MSSVSRKQYGKSKEDMGPLKRKAWKSGQMSCREVRSTIVCIEDAFIERHIHNMKKKYDMSSGKDNSTMTKYY